MLGPVTGLAVAPSGTLFVTGGEDGEVLLWSATEQTLLQRWKAHNNNRINALLFMPDERLVVSGAGDNSALIWSIEEDVAVNRLAHGERRHRSGNRQRRKIYLHRLGRQRFAHLGW